MTLTYTEAAREIERRIAGGMAQADARRAVWQENPHLKRDRLRARHNDARARAFSPDPAKTREDFGRSGPTPDIPLALVPKEDGSAWADVLARLKRDQRVVTVSHVADCHFPEHDPTALDLAYRLIERKQPDVIVVGSDSADFGVISRFDPLPDQQESIDDALDNFRGYWQAHIDRLRATCPNAALVHIFGNHEARIVQHMEQQAPKLRRTVERAWVETVTYGGRVLYPGRVSEVEIGGLLVKHGDAHGEHPAKKLLEVESFQVSVMAGHVHRPTSYTRRGRRYEVSAITSGCLCKLDPAYAKGRRQNWQHGTAFATVDMQGAAVWFDNVVFRENGSKLLAFSDGSLLEQAA